MHYDANDARSLAKLDMRRVRAAALAATLGGLLEGCGGGSSAPAMPAMSTVTLVISSDADGRFIGYNFTLQGLTLTNAAGKTVTLSASSSASSSSSSSSSFQPQNLEFIHVNGKIEPHLTVTIPQDTYTSAAVTAGGSAEVTCANLADLLDRTSFLSSIPTASTVTLPEPLVVNSESAAVMLKLLVSQSATVDCTQANPTGATVENAKVTPTFTLSSLAISTTPASPLDGVVDDLEGQVMTIDGQTAKILLANNPNSNPIAVAADGATVFDGVSGLQNLTAGEFVIVSGALQTDGSIRATRVTLQDPMAPSALSGPLLGVSTASSGPQLNLVDNLIGGNFVGPTVYQATSSTVLSVLDAPSNLTSLPFTPSATAASLVSGQNVYLTNSQFIDTNSTLDSVGTATLLPQTIDGQISSVATSGNFTVYTLSLASYDTIVVLAGLTGQLTQLAAPGAVTVYVDGSTQMLSSQTPAVGDTLRFYGLLFNNSGTLVMDCMRILDGVPFSSAQTGAGG